ncbi:hypothetical protein, partial [Thermobrachium celere]
MNKTDKDIYFKLKSEDGVADFNSL